jgi:Family of unknown function (DUF5723)
MRTYKSPLPLILKNAFSISRLSGRKAFVAFLLFFCFNQLHAQEQLGLKLENYSGINSVLFNPTYQLTAPMTWNLNLVSAGVFLDNNYAFLENTSTINAIRRRNDILSKPDLNPETDNPDDFLLLDYFNGNNKKQGSVLATVMGPSLMLHLKTGWSLGLYTNYRMASSIRRVPSSLNYYTFDAQENLENFAVSPFKSAGMSWGELGINVAKKIPLQRGNSIGFGVNMKILTGNDAFFFNNNTTFDLAKLRDDTLSFQSLDVTYGYTESLDNDGNYVRQRSGLGMGLDIGFSYIEETSGGDYHWKAGAALIDIGRINFNQNSPQFAINSNNAFTVAMDNFEDLNSLESRSDLLSLAALNNAQAAENGDEFKIWLPTALTAYVDYHLTKSVFLNGALVQSIPIGKNAVRRDNQLVVTPRYERKWFGAMMPVSLYNYRELRVGLAARLAFLTLGTENLRSFFRQKEFTGSDFYVGVRVNPFNLGLGDGGADGRKPKGCYW